MKHTKTTDSTATSPILPDWKRRLLRGTALSAAVVIGLSTTFLAIAPAARALAAQSGMDDHGSFLASMHGGMHSHDDMHAHLDKLMTDAGVGEAQKQQIHAIMKDAMTAEHADMEKFHDSCSQLKTLLTARTIDNAAIASVRAGQDRLMLATSHRLTDTVVAVANILTPDQRAKLGAEFDRMMASHDMHHHGG